MRGRPVSNLLETPTIDRIRVEAGGFPTRGVITRFPSAFRDLPEPHRRVLAVLAAAGEVHQGPVPKQVIYRAIARSVAGSRHSGFSRHGLAEQFERVAGNLLDYGLIESDSRGYELSADVVGARPSWNGEFSRLVVEARSLLEE